MNDSQQKEILQNLESSKRITSRDATILVTEHEDPTPDDELPMEDPLEMPQEEQLKPEKRRKAVNLRIVGCCRNNWSQVSICLILATISIEFYIVLARVTISRVLDYPNYKFMGIVLPRFTEYDKICMQPMRSKGCQI